MDNFGISASNTPHRRKKAEKTEETSPPEKKAVTPSEQQAQDYQSLIEHDGT